MTGDPGRSAQVSRPFTGEPQSQVSKEAEYTKKNVTASRKAKP